VQGKLPAGSEAASSKLDEMLAVLDGTVAATRRIAADLRPLLLDDLGLASAVEWLVQSFIQRSGIACSLSVEEDMELHEPYATAVFRILQEVLANVGKHARASHAAVDIARDADALVLRVSDDGRGFSLTEPRKPESLGLMGLRERVRLLKGNMEIDSAPGRGTRISVRIPVSTKGEPN
jgi:signal transduction histidine kinase